jgi:hypothetical protein
MARLLGAPGSALVFNAPSTGPAGFLGMPILGWVAGLVIAAGAVLLRGRRPAHAEAEVIAPDPPGDGAP